MKLGAFVALALISAGGISACSAGPKPITAPQPAATSTPVASAAAEPESDGRLHRAELDAVLKQGPAWVLERVPIEEVLNKGKFIGWRVMSLPPMWQELELQPGDVVTQVNDTPLQKPTDLWAAWTKLSAADHLKVSYLRDDKALAMTVPIHGQPDPNMPVKLQAKPKRQPTSPNKRKSTVIIRGEDRPLSDTTVSW